MQCHICQHPSEHYGQLLVLFQYQVSYFRCTFCGFIQTENPYWLAEAYTEAIASQDVGAIGRNILNASLTGSLLTSVLRSFRQGVDFGGGHGVFVRLMRDRGYPFFWKDLYAANLFARGFEATPEQSYDLVTAFEVLEHLVDPLADLKAVIAHAPNALVSTLLVPHPTPALRDWWYFSPSSGQHIAFYTPKALQIIAERFGRHLQSAGPYHLFTEKPVSAIRYRLAMNPRYARLTGLVSRRPSLLTADHKKMVEAPPPNLVAETPTHLES